MSTRYFVSADETGKDVVELRYRRPFEKETPPRKVFKLDVTVCASHL